MYKDLPTHILSISLKKIITLCRHTKSATIWKDAVKSEVVLLKNLSLALGLKKMVNQENKEISYLPNIYIPNNVHFFFSKMVIKNVMHTIIRTIVFVVGARAYQLTSTPYLRDT